RRPNASSTTIPPSTSKTACAAPSNISAPPSGADQLPPYALVGRPGRSLGRAARRLPFEATQHVRRKDAGRGSSPVTTGRLDRSGRATRVADAQRNRVQCCCSASTTGCMAVWHAPWGVPSEGEQPEGYEDVPCAHGVSGLSILRGHVWSCGRGRR